MELLAELREIHEGRGEPLIVGAGGSLTFGEIAQRENPALSEVGPGDVAALIGRFDPVSVASLLRLIDLRAIVVPLSLETREQHEYFFGAAGVDVVVEGSSSTRIRAAHWAHPLLEGLRNSGHPGLVLFTSGTTGSPKSILHDFPLFLQRYRTPRAALRTLSFLQFDHIGGINTLLHTLFNRGVVIVPSGTSPEKVVGDLRRFDAELLPTTPTFLRMLLLSGLLEGADLPSLRLVTYGAEPMDPHTLQELSQELPEVDFRQTYGLSELGILRVRSRARDSLWMKIGGEGVSTRVIDGVLQIRSDFRMLGYLNAPSPFQDGWYDTGDLVEEDGEFLRVTGRRSRVINVGGTKIQPEEIERVGLLHPQVLHCQACGAPNPITGQHIEVTCELRDGGSIAVQALREHFSRHLPREVRPHRIRIAPLAMGHRLKRR